MTRAGPHADLGEVLAGVLGQPARVTAVVRSRYSTSAPIDDVSAVLADGEQLQLVHKDLAWSSLMDGARASKPRFLHDPRREIGVYQQLLAMGPEGPPHCYAALIPPPAERWALVLEKVRGLELFQVGERTLWEAAARWAAELHVRFRDRAVDLVDGPVPVLVHDADWLDQWARRAEKAGSPGSLACVVGAVPALIELIAAQPPTLVHGEFYASNILVAATPQRGLRVAPIDWEMAAIAPALIDLAALTAGNWDPTDRAAIEAAYCDTAGRPRDADFARELDACRLALCIQWLGWCPGWQAPAEHSHDWLSEAVILVDRLGLA